MGNIEKILTGNDYKKAKKVVEKYKNQLRKEVREEQKNCEHKSYYRHWYDEDHLLDTCRKCFYEWEDNSRPVLFEDYPALIQGEFRKTNKDEENYQKYQARLEAINKL